MLEINTLSTFRGFIVLMSFDDTSQKDRLRLCKGLSGERCRGLMKATLKSQSKGWRMGTRKTSSTTSRFQLWINGILIVLIMFDFDLIFLQCIFLELFSGKTKRQNRQMCECPPETDVLIYSLLYPSPFLNTTKIIPTVAGI